MSKKPQKKAIREATAAAQQAAMHNPAFDEVQQHSTAFKVVSWVLVALWAAFIFFMSSNSGTGLNEGLGVFSSIYQSLQVWQESLLGPDVDVLSPIAHFCEYAVLACLLANALRAYTPLQKACIIAAVVASAYGITDEVHQLFVPDRACDAMDWLTDTCGGIMGILIAWAAFQNPRNYR